MAVRWYQRYGLSYRDVEGLLVQGFVLLRVLRRGGMGSLTRSTDTNTYSRVCHA